MPIVFLISLLINGMSIFANFRAQGSENCKPFWITKESNQFLFANEREFFNEVQRLQPSHIFGEVLIPGELDYMQFSSKVFKMSPEEKRHYLNKIGNNLHSLANQYGDVFRYRLALLVLGDKPAWINWFNELFLKGQEPQQIKTISPHFSKLDQGFQEKILQDMRVQWGLTKNLKPAENRLTPRKSIELFWGYLSNPQRYFEKLPPLKAFEEYYKAVEFIAGKSEIPFNQIIAALKDIQNGVGSGALGVESIIIFGSFPNGKAHRGSDIDFARSFNAPSSQFAGQRVNHDFLYQISIKRFNEELLFSEAYHDNHDKLLAYALAHNHLVIEIKKDQWVFYLSPYFQGFLSPRDEREIRPLSYSYRSSIGKFAQ